MARITPAAPRNRDFSRRQFVVTAITASGGFALALSPLPAAARNTGARLWQDDATPAELNPWIVVETDDTVVVRVPQSELGNGLTTTLPQLIAEELECEWSRVKVEYASPNRNIRERSVYGGMKTSSSRGVMTTYASLQQAGASARERLIAAAAARWNVAATECAAARSRVMHAASGRSVTFGQLASDAAKIKLAAEPAIRKPHQFKFAGKSVPRLDTPVKVRGEARYGIDTRLPGMVYAAFMAAPVIGGKLVAVDETPIAGRRGIIKVVQLDYGVAVIADNYWRAKEALGALKVAWDGGAAAKTDSAQFSRMYRDMLGGPMAVARNDGDAPAAFARGGGRIIEAVYEVPFLAHAPMEPQNATVRLQKDRLDIWLGTQSPIDAANLAAQLAGLKPEQVYVHNFYVGGGFGRRTRNDDVRSAVRVAMAAGLDSPIKVIWTREEDMTHGRYRPQSVTSFRAMLGADGIPVAFESRIAMPSILVSMAEQELKDGIDWTSVEVINSAPYKIPNYRVGQAVRNTHIPLAFWRSVGGSQNTFFMESFMDELAHAAGRDPLAYRRAMIDRADFLLVIDKLAEKSNWGSPLPKGRGRGIAVAQRKYLVDGSVAEITVSNDGDIRVDRVIVAYDFSRTVNPSIVEAQIQGGVHWALSGMFYGEITIKNGAVEQTNFDTYNMVRLAQAPAVEVYEVQTGRDEWGGVGELGATSVVGAVANAIFAVTGKRVRSLPLKNIDRRELVPV